MSQPTTSPPNGGWKESQMELMQAHQQWCSRPDDERFLDLESLHAATLDRANRSEVEVVRNRDLQITGERNGGDLLSIDVSHTAYGGESMTVEPTHWSFGQLASRARVPAKWARENTHPQIAALALNYGLQVESPKDDSMVMFVKETDGTELRCMTSTGYGRIYDHKVVEAVQGVNADGRWQVPAATYQATNPKRATTLYASDRDVFGFLVDPNNPIEIKRPDGGVDILFRGFMFWNSEVGSQTFGLMTFFYRFACDNRIIWGAEDVRELRIRHTLGAPDRFIREGQPLLAKYADASTKRTIEVAQSAMKTEVGKTDDEVTDWLRKQNFNLKEAQRVVEKAKEEEGQARTVWDLVQGGTAIARGVQHTDSRIEMERKASKLLRRVA